MSRELADQVINHLAAHPYTGPRLPVAELALSTRPDGIHVLGDIPDTIGITVGLLEAALLEYVSYEHGVITLAVQPEPLHYEPVYREEWPDMIVCRRVEAA